MAEGARLESTAAFRERAAELAGYDVSEAGDVRALN